MAHALEHIWLVPPGSKGQVALSEQELADLVWNEDDFIYEPPEVSAEDNQFDYEELIEDNPDELNPKESKVKDALLPAEAYPLYIRRDVVNAAEIQKWAKAQGFTHLLRGLHVTQLYSKAPVLHHDMVSPMGLDPIMVLDSGQRTLAQLGPNGALVMKFDSLAMQHRHKELMEKGANFDFDKYQPHISLSYKPEHYPADISSIKPYDGPIFLAPEIFEVITPEQIAKVPNWEEDAL